jgi:hypothetical protein
VQPLGFFDRFFFAWASFFRVLLDGTYAAQARALGSVDVSVPVPVPVPVPVLLAPPAERNLSPALELLALLQDEGRFVDFLQEDITAAADADVGVAARVVHAGCRKVLADRLAIEPLRTEEEGAEVVVPAGFSAAEVKLTGALRGEAPFRGILRHRGWIAQKITLPAPTAAHRSEILAAAEVEL